MTLRELREFLLDWFSSGFCNLFHSKANMCDFYGRDWGELTVSQALFTVWVIYFVFAVITK